MIVDEVDLKEFLRVNFPEEGEKCWFVDNQGDLSWFVYGIDDAYSAEHNRIFRTEKEAKFERERVKFQIFMDREFAKNSDPIDWEDEDQIRCPIYD